MEADVTEENRRRLVLHQRGRPRVMNLVEPKLTHKLYSRGKSEPHLDETSWKWRWQYKTQLLHRHTKMALVPSENKGTGAQACLASIWACF